MKHISETEIKTIVDEVKSAVNITEEIELLLIAGIRIIEHFCGISWVKKNLQKNQVDDFLRLRSVLVDNNAEESTKCSDRVIALAEGLLNLQSELGFQFFVDELERNENNRTESSFAVLDASRILKRLGIQFQFKQALPDSSYDFDIIDKDDVIPCEVKCKIELTKLSESTIRDSLMKAENQLPSGTKSIVFMKIPENWLAHRELKKSLEGEILDTLSKRKSIIAVVVYFEGWLTEIHLSHKLKTIEYVTYINNDSNQLVVSDSLLESFKSSEGSWLPLRDFL